MANSKLPERFIPMPILLLFATMASSCMHRNTSEYSVEMADANGVAVSDATIVPVCEERKFVATGAEGWGSESTPIRFIGDPYRWTAGDDLRPPRDRSSGAMVFPMVVVGKHVGTYRWLVLKTGCAPMLLYNKYGQIYSSNTIDSSGNFVLGEEPPPKVFRLKSGGGDERRELIRSLVSDGTDLESFRRIFALNADISENRISRKGKKLIQNQR